MKILSISLVHEQTLLCVTHTYPVDKVIPVTSRSSRLEIKV